MSTFALLSVNVVEGLEEYNILIQKNYIFMQFLGNWFSKLPLLQKILLTLILISVVFLIVFLLNKQITPIIPVTTPGKRQIVKVEKVIDGDTIKIEGGKSVRYIGIDSPEVANSGEEAGCFSEEAFLKNKELVEGGTVEIEKDVSETDQYGRLLRYIYIDGILINELLVRGGYAVIDPFPPDIKYQEKLKEAEGEAKTQSKGIWQDCTCSAKTDCRQMVDCNEAGFYYETCQLKQLDSDGDGIPCESLCQ